MSLPCLILKVLCRLSPSIYLLIEIGRRVFLCIEICTLPIKGVWRLLFFYPGALLFPALRAFIGSFCKLIANMKGL